MTEEISKLKVELGKRLPEARFSESKDLSRMKRALLQGGEDQAERRDRKAKSRSVKTASGGLR